MIDGLPPLSDHVSDTRHLLPQGVSTPDPETVDSERISSDDIQGEKDY
jgi:hypothetical protein